MSLQSLERSRKRKNEDEEIMFVILPALHLYLTSQRKREIRHKSFLYGKESVRELLGGHLKNCLAAFRMEPHIFMWLASYLREQGLISDSRIKVQEKLAFFLYMLSHNASYEKLQLEFQHSGWSFSKYVREFFVVASPSKIKPNKPKKSPKKSSADGLVGVMERFVKIKEKEANHEATQNFAIIKCIAELRNLEGFNLAQKARAFAVFKSDENREIFLNTVDDKDGSALAWLQMEMDKLT